MSIDNPGLPRAKARGRIVAPLVFLGVVLVAWDLANDSEVGDHLVLPPPR